MSINDTEEASDNSGAVVDSSWEGIGTEGADGAELGITTDEAESEVLSSSDVGALLCSATQMLKRTDALRTIPEIKTV
jgi:hypothetical protein